MLIVGTYHRETACQIYICESVISK